MNTIYLILTLIIVLLSYNLVYGSKQRETFETTNTINENIINDSSVNKLTDLNKKTPIFKDFCIKLNFINNNHNESARQVIKFNNIITKKLNLSKQTANKYLQEIIDLQKKIYSDEADLEYREKYEHKLNNKVDKQLKVIEKAIENISGNLSGEIKLNLI
jgi:hypothetical protein